MTDDLERQVDAIFAHQGNIFCGNCFYFAPKIENGERCRHPHAHRLIKTYAGMEVYYVQPEERNKHWDCADFRQATFGSRTTNDPKGFARIMIVTVFGIFAMVFGIFGIAGLLSRVWP
jgi:hypothetical protein